MIIWSILRPLEIFYGHLVYFVVIWYIFLHFGILYNGKSGNPVPRYVMIYKTFPAGSPVDATPAAGTPACSPWSRFNESVSAVNYKQKP
jgi:hypothetical protein